VMDEGRGGTGGPLLGMLMFALALLFLLLS
jgi:hypothetical protein